MESSPSSAPALSVVVPVHNEVDNLTALLEEIHPALEGTVDFEVVYLDDASSDETPRRLVSPSHHWTTIVSARLEDEVLVQVVPLRELLVVGEQLDITLPRMKKWGHY